MDDIDALLGLGAKTVDYKDPAYQMELADALRGRRRRGNMLAISDMDTVARAGREQASQARYSLTDLYRGMRESELDAENKRRWETKDARDRQLHAANMASKNCTGNPITYTLRDGTTQTGQMCRGPDGRFQFTPMDSLQGAIPYKAPTGKGAGGPEWKSYENKNDGTILTIDETGSQPGRITFPDGTVKQMGTEETKAYLDQYREDLQEREINAATAEKNQLNQVEAGKEYMGSLRNAGSDIETRATAINNVINGLMRGGVTGNLADILPTISDAGAQIQQGIEELRLSGLNNYKLYPISDKDLEVLGRATFPNQNPVAAMDWARHQNRALQLGLQINRKLEDRATQLMSEPDKNGRLTQKDILELRRYRNQLWADTGFSFEWSPPEGYGVPKPTAGAAVKEIWNEVSNDPGMMRQWQMEDFDRWAPLPEKYKAIEGLDSMDDLYRVGAELNERREKRGEPILGYREFLRRLDAKLGTAR